MASNEDRLKALSQRFSKREEDPTPETKTTTPKKEVVRRRHSLYLDNALVGLCDQVYKQVAHELFPAEINKSEFLEALLKYGLDHLGDIKTSLTQS